MDLPYQNDLYELRKWIDFISTNMSSHPFRTPQEAKKVKGFICAIATAIQNEHPFYANMLPRIANNLFQCNDLGTITLNPVAFGELAISIKYIDAEPFSMRVWNTIHTRITSVSYELYKDGHYSSAAEKALKEVETRLREKFSELKPDTSVPAKVNDIIGALLSENGAFKFCDISTTSGKDYRRGIQHLFEGTIAAYRNPSAHANLKYNNREAMEQIMLASQLMFVLDK